VPWECLYVADGENYELAAAAKVGLVPLLIRTCSHESLGELRREAKEWQGNVISSLSEVCKLLEKPI
jgi:hypothetical protein